MKRVDLHVHSTYSDGISSPNEIIQKAIEKNMDVIGISDHSYTEFDESYCMKKESITDYIDELLSLKNKYKDDIDIRCGIELDYYSNIPISSYDYVIGSVHYVKVDNKYIPVDESADILTDAVNEYFSGDIYSLVELYFETVSDIMSKGKIDIIGHFDLITKFNENNKLFDENNPRYIAAYKKAADKLLKENVVFEINTGAISRGYRSSPYPSEQIYTYLKDNGAKFILSSDSHSKDTLCFDFQSYEQLV